MSDLPTPPSAVSAEGEAVPLFERGAAPPPDASSLQQVLPALTATPGLDVPVTPVEPEQPTLPEEPAPLADSAAAPHFRTDLCPRCGYADFGAGTVITYNGGFHPAYFKPARLTFRRLSWLWRPFRAIVELEAQVCRQCGLVMLQVNTDKLRHVEKQSGDRE